MTTFTKLVLVCIFTSACINSYGQIKIERFDLINKSIEGRQFGCLGEARINVLKLNIALDELEHQTSGTVLGSQ